MKNPYKHMPHSSHDFAGYYLFQTLLLNVHMWNFIKSRKPNIKTMHKFEDHDPQITKKKDKQTQL